MLRRLVPAVLLAALAGVLLVTVPGGAPAATERRCGALAGNPGAPQGIRALRVSCRRARRVARRHATSGGRSGPCSLGRPSCRIDGWRCTRSFFGNSGTRVRCKRGERRVRFFYGV